MRSRPLNHAELTEALAARGYTVDFSGERGWGRKARQGGSSYQREKDESDAVLHHQLFHR